ncbi:hypothetical protein JHK86_049149 [Glycine max]|nr:hypothetical protein JHK86_049149 [Glycine max]
MDGSRPALPGYKCKEALSKQRMVIESLQREIEFKNHKLMEMEHKHSETLTSVRRLIVGLVENINCKERSLLQMECKHSESLNMVQKLMNERDKLQERCHQDLQLTKVTNANMNHDMECLKKDDGQIIKELEESKALHDLQQNFMEEIEKLKRELGNQNYVGSGGHLNNQISTFRSQLKDKMEYLELVENLHSFLVVKEQQYRQELHDARKECINMENHSSEESMSRRSIAFVSLKEVIESQKQNVFKMKSSINEKVIQLEKQLESIPKLEFENQQLKEKLDVMKHMEDEFLNMVGTLHMNVMEKERSLVDSEDFNQSLIIKEREIKDEQLERN